MELGQGHSRAIRKQDSEQLFQGGQAQQEPRTLSGQLVSAERGTGQRKRLLTAGSQASATRADSQVEHFYVGAGR